ncbi:DUF177 domain-containing protein [Mechercharimyces sp. CAU 1602]|uniref:YceD family protein n=1 Tax=Mechercharimyces sp. CAU 1602 TaxID=2973933 RepID=UPI0021612448|nr:DUF177 domain-containing protein [Mechercharimyces sp. CAU 1602]MCS1351370.1 DUF177 domain-containing protein [Mechercharimyces sp. CAU 1602]
MQISLIELHQMDETRVWKATVELKREDWAQISQLQSLSPLQVEVKAEREEGLYRLTGKQTAEAVFDCSRCVERYTTTLTMRWSQLITDQAHRIEKDAETEVHLIQGAEVDVLPYIREALLLGLPLAPLCAEDCKGLCAKCGSNQNEQPCNCNVDRIDPRLQDLELLLKNDGESSS